VLFNFFTHKVTAFVTYINVEQKFFNRRIRVSSKQTKINFGSNQNKPKQDLFRVCFGLFRETKRKNFGLFRCFEPISKQPKQTELFRNKPKQTETTLNFLKNYPNIRETIETNCFETNRKKRKTLSHNWLSCPLI